MVFERNINSMSDGFDYGKYIWQIQFYDKPLIQETGQTCTTIDYLNQKLIIRSTDNVKKLYLRNHIR